MFQLASSWKWLFELVLTCFSLFCFFACFVSDSNCLVVLRCSVVVKIVGNCFALLQDVLHSLGWFVVIQVATLVSGCSRLSVTGF